MSDGGGFYLREKYLMLLVPKLAQLPEVQCAPVYQRFAFAWPDMAASVRHYREHCA